MTAALANWLSHTLHGFAKMSQGRDMRGSMDKYSITLTGCMDQFKRFIFIADHFPQFVNLQRRTLVWNTFVFHPVLNEKRQIYS